MRIPPWTIALSALAFIGGPALSQNAGSLDEVPGLLKSPEAKAVWAEQIEGRPAPDHLGTRDLAGLDGELLTQLLLPEIPPGRITLLGARQWAQYPGHIVALACYGDAPPVRSESRCETGDGAQMLGVLRVDDSGAVQLVSRLRLDTDVEWPMLSWEPGSPLQMEEAGESPMPQRWERFDLAVYHLSPDSPPALGLRGVWSEGYAGGGGFWSALYLFELRDGALELVFGAGMSMYRDIAGDWNPDGTREHHIEDWASVLIVEPRVHHGYRDLRVRERGDRGGDLYRWSPSAHSYRRVD